MHDAGAYLTMALQRAGDCLQEGIPTLDRKRPGSGQNGIKLGIGKRERHGGGLHRLAGDGRQRVGWQPPHSEEVLPRGPGRGALLVRGAQY
jgi:hypothetical protein